MSTTHELKLKTTTVHGITYWHCLYCWRETKSKSTMNAHINIEHKEEKLADIAEMIEDEERGNHENSDNRI